MSIIDTDSLISSILPDKPEPTEEELETFKNLVNDWFKYDDQIRKLTIAIKERKKYQNALNNKIQDFMIQYKYNDLNTQNGRIKSNIREIKMPLSMSEIKKKIKEYGGDEVFNQIFNEEDRPKIIKKSIKRIIPTVSLNL